MRSRCVPATMYSPARRHEGLRHRRGAAGHGVAQGVEIDRQVVHPAVRGIGLVGAVVSVDCDRGDGRRVVGRVGVGAAADLHLVDDVAPAGCRHVDRVGERQRPARAQARQRHARPESRRTERAERGHAGHGRGVAGGQRLGDDEAGGIAAAGIDDQRGEGRGRPRADRGRADLGNVEVRVVAAARTAASAAGSQRHRDEERRIRKQSHRKDTPSKTRDRETAASRLCSVSEPVPRRMESRNTSHA